MGNQRNSFKMKVAVAFCLVFVACVSADFSIDVPEEDRTFCQISTRLACTNACSGKGCTENCISRCGILSRPFTYTCSTVAATTCTAATTAALGGSPSAASAPFTV